MASVHLLRLRGLRAVLAAAALCATAISPANARILEVETVRIQEVETDCQRTSQGFRCLTDIVEVVEGENTVWSSLPAPQIAGWLTYARATLVNRNDRPIAGHLVHLHHVGWSDSASNQVVCGDRYEDLVYITGKERTRMDYPEGHGFFWRGDGDSWRLQGMLHGMHSGMTVRARVRLTFQYVPGGNADMSRVRNNWLPVTGCGNPSTYDVEAADDGARRHRKTYTFEMPVSGRFVWGTGHLHDGGIKMVFKNLTTAKRIFVSRALYEGDHRWDLTGTTNFSSEEGVHVDAGDMLQIVAVYNSTRDWEDVMGNLRASLVLEDA